MLCKLTHDPFAARRYGFRMDSLPDHLRRLDEMLLDLGDDDDGMLLSELDGFLAGVIVSPDPILPSEWLRIIWGGDEGGDSAPFDDSGDVRAFVGLVMRHYNDIVRALERRGRYSPILEIDTRHDETLWELWISGFARAVRLRPDGWTRVVDADDEEAIQAYSGLLLLNQVNEGLDELSDEQTNALDEQAEDLIPMWVETLHAWRRKHDAAGQNAATLGVRTKVGRNDPCPCGSGKKWKKCCGLN